MLDGGSGSLIILYVKTLKVVTFVFEITIVFLPYLCAGNFSIILLLILCAFKWYGECLYRHIFLEDTCTNIKATKISAHVKLHSHNSGMHG